MKKPKPAKWSKLRKHIQKQGGQSNGLYNTPKRSPLTDTPHVGEELKETIIHEIDKYYKEKGKLPTAAKLNKQFGLRATTNYYRGLTK